ncbi:MAG: Dabb family protein [Desulfobacteraceae bacterium]|nr:Dabb family protein [Desulfobacteraceae bacterium]
MIQHMVCMKFKPDVSDAEIQRLEKLLDPLPNHIIEIQTFEFGRDVLRSERSFDFGLVSLFANEAALQRYQVHPEHQKVVRHIQDICVQVVTVDFLYEYKPREDIDATGLPVL